MPPLTLANAITLFRVFLTPAFCAFVYGYSPEQAWMRWAALGVYLAAGVSDMLDGFVARHFSRTSKFGARLDPLADKLIVNLAYVFIASNEHFYELAVPAWFLWVPVIILARDAVIVLGALAITEIIGQRDFRPSILGKATTLFQMGTVLAILLALPYTTVLIFLTLLLTLLSFADYVYIGAQAARRGEAV